MSGKNANDAPKKTIVPPTLFTAAALAVPVPLKLAGYIDWPWLWVLSPLWITASVLVVMIVAVLVLALLLPGEDN